MRNRAAFLAIVLLSLTQAAFAQSMIANNPGVKPTVAIRNATIYPISSAPIANGTIVFSKGVITAVGRDVVIPQEATVIDGTGLSVYPGMIDSGSTVGLTETDSVPGTVDTAETGELNPDARAAVALNPHSDLIPVTRVNGVTNVVSTPEGGLISGQSALIRLSGWTPAEMVVKSPAALHVRFPRLRSVDPDDDDAKDTTKKYGSDVDALRREFLDARAYAKAAAARAKGARRFDRDLALEALVPFVEGKAPVVLHAELERDIRAALAFADELQLTNVILAGAQDVGRVLPELKKRNIPVLLGAILALPAREDDPYDLLFSNAKLLYDNGIRFAIQSQEAHNTRNLPYHAAACAAFGLPKEEAIRAITLSPAQIFGVADRLGSLEPGKEATLFVSDGDPLEIRTNVRRVFIAGEEISMESRHTRLYEKFSKRP